MYGLTAAFRPLKDLYGDIRVVDFGPLDLKDVSSHLCLSAPEHVIGRSLIVQTALTGAGPLVDM